MEIDKMGVSLPEPLSEEQFVTLPKSLVVAVVDTGVGISAANIPVLFSKFKQLDNKAIVPSIRGTGLGLAIARGILEGHGGVVGVVSKMDAGSAFYFALPLTKQELQ